MENNSLLDFKIVVNIFSISTQSAKIVFISMSDKKSVALSNLSQYLVSVVSFNAIEILEMKSALLCACCASATFAPILVPERKSCLESTNSFFLSERYLYSLTILIAKSKLFFSIIFFIIQYKSERSDPKFSTFHFQFSIMILPPRCHLPKSCVSAGSAITHMRFMSQDSLY